MGSWFSNIHIRKNETATEETIIRYISKLMATRQYEPSESAEDADAMVAIVSGADRPWISVYSDALVHDDPDSCTAVAGPISAELHTDVLGIACFDSDYLYLNLVNRAEEINAWIGIGRGADVGIQRRTALTPWKKKVSDYPAFSARAKEQYVCADEFLAEAATNLGLPMEQSAASPEYLKDMGLEAETSCLYFRLREDAQNGKGPQLGIFYMRYAMPCFADKENKVYVLNVGEESKGLSVHFLGPYVEKEEITFSDVILKMPGRPDISIELTKTQLTDGQWAYSYYDPEFAIPPKVPNRMVKEKRSRLIDERMFTLRFVPHGNPRKMLDITVMIAPTENPQGQAQWNIWKPHGSRAAFIEHHNKLWKRLRAYETDPNNLLPLLKEEDFD